MKVCSASLKNEKTRIQQYASNSSISMTESWTQKRALLLWHLTLREKVSRSTYLLKIAFFCRFQGKVVQKVTFFSLKLPPFIDHESPLVTGLCLLGVNSSHVFTAKLPTFNINGIDPDRISVSTLLVATPS